MIIIGCDYHPGFQQIAFVDTDTGEVKERKLRHREKAEEFYRQLKVSGETGAGWDGSQWTCPLV
jgi:transposase